MYIASPFRFDSNVDSNAAAAEIMAANSAVTTTTIPVDATDGTVGGYSGNTGDSTGTIVGLVVGVVAFLVIIVLVVDKKRKNALKTASRTNVVVVPSAKSTEMTSTGTFSCTKNYS